MSKKWSIAVDFDGVIHQYVSKWTKATEISDPPMPGAFEWLQEMVKHFDVVIFSARLTPHPKGDGTLDWDTANKTREMMRVWFRNHGMPEYFVDELVFWQQPGKPTALIYIDDRAYRFKGRFPTKGDIHKLRPWKIGDPHPAQTHTEVLHTVVEMVEAFDERTKEEDYADTGEAWELFNLLKDMAKKALGPPTKNCRCTKCGGFDVQFVDWYDPNKERAVADGFIGDWDYAARRGQTYCEDCDDHTVLEWVGY